MQTVMANYLLTMRNCCGSIFGSCADFDCFATTVLFIGLRTLAMKGNSNTNQKFYRRWDKVGEYSLLTNCVMC